MSAQKIRTTASHAPVASTPREVLNARAVAQLDTGTARGMAPSSVRPFVAMGCRCPKKRAMMEMRMQATAVPLSTTQASRRAAALSSKVPFAGKLKTASSAPHRVLAAAHAHKTLFLRVAPRIRTWTPSLARASPARPDFTRQGVAHGTLSVPNCSRVLQDPTHTRKAPGTAFCAP